MDYKYTFIANVVSDSLLASARTTQDSEEQKKSYVKFADQLRTDIPALFLYVPEFTYLAPTAVKNIEFRSLASPSERFNTISAWYRNIESIWPIFAHQPQ